MARPAIGGNTKNLIFVPQTNLTSLDPVWTTATATRNFSLMVYENLYGRDQQFVPQPLMVEGHVIEDDGKRWTMTLREGLLWHDGTKVLARDCVASLQRWLKRDATAPIIMDRVEAFEAKDDRTLVWRLRRPFPLLAHFLSKVQPQPVMMPERIAATTDPYKQVSEIVGSGPLKFLPDEYVSGIHAGFARFDGYVPRQEPAVVQRRRPQGECRSCRMARHSGRGDRRRGADGGRGRLVGAAAARPDPDAGQRRAA